MVPMEKVKCFHDFYNWKIYTFQCWFGVICNFYLYQKNAFQQLQGGLCNEFDSSSFELKVFRSAL